MEEARETLDTVSTIGATEIMTISDLLPEVVNRLGDTTRGKQTGYAGLDAVTGGLREGHLVIIAARPGIGKTSFACNLAANMCRQGNDMRLLFDRNERSGDSREDQPFGSDGGQV
jgi:replicative DNA helicase